jgi:hypothetical protein
MIVVVANYDSANKSTVSWTRKRIMVKTKKNTAYVSGMRKSSSYEYFLLFPSMMHECIAEEGHRRR